jgi:hypothetical protein
VENNNYHIDIKAYLEGKLDPRAMHEFEKQALEDPFLADALEGYSNSSPGARRQLSILQRQLAERITQQEVNKENFYFSWQRLSIAAAGGVMIILATVLFWMKADRASNVREKNIEILIDGKGSLTENSIANTSDVRTQPIGGWANYQEYLKSNVRVPIDLEKPGQVIVEFTVDKTGNLNNFEVVHSLTEASNKEAIRLIKDGPKWQSVQSTSQVQLKINFP